jgi:ABC-type uncharacterized transport system substrate-binding protein
MVRTISKASVLSSLFVVLLLAVAVMAEAQQPKLYRVGVITSGGAWYETIAGLRLGLRQLGLEEGKQFILAIRDTKGDPKTAEEAARNLEQDKVNLIYTTASSVAIAARRATAEVSIVFAAGADPVDLGLVESFAKPGGRFTGVYYRDADLTAKRLETLKEIVAKLHRIVTFYNQSNPVASKSATLARRLLDCSGWNLSNDTSPRSSNCRRVCDA